MNSKHISCAIVAVFIAILIQVTLSLKNNRLKAQQESDALDHVTKERLQLSDLKRQSADLIEFLRIWQSQFDLINTAQSAEVNFSMLVRNSGLVNLAQSFRTEAVKGNPSILSELHAELVFEDDYIQLLNWLGKVENKLPTMRVRDVHISKGSRPGDIRLETSLEQPLIAK